MPSESSAIIHVAAGLVFRNGQLLLTQRRPGDHLGGFWEFPGGKIEPGESSHDCLQRELREELGIEVEVGECVERVQHRYPEKTVSLQFFKCALVRGEPQTLGCAALVWVRADELPSYELPAADARLRQKLQQQPELWC